MIIPKLSECTLIKTQGLCNENYIFAKNNKKFVLRKLIRTDIDRDLEFEIQALAFKKNISDKPILYSKEKGIMISAFIEGVHKKTLDIVDINNLVKALKQLHSIIIDSKTMDIFSAIKNKSDNIIDSFNTISNYENEYVLCHNDLNPQNILFNNGVKIIDWEYSGMNDRYFDLASVCVEFKLNTQDEKIFLKQYFDNEIIHMKKLIAYKNIYVKLCEQWFDENIQST